MHPTRVEQHLTAALHKYKIHKHWITKQSLQRQCFLIQEVRSKGQIDIHISFLKCLLVINCRNEKGKIMDASIGWEGDL